MRFRFSLALLALALVSAACTSAGSDSAESTAADENSTASEESSGDAAEDDTTGIETTEADADESELPGVLDWPRPEVPTGDLDPDLELALGEAVILAQTGIPANSLTRIAESGDPRAAWVIVDLLRFLQGSPTGDRLVGVYTDLTGAGVDPFRPWSSATNQMIAWDIPEPPGLIDFKRQLFTLGEPKWTEFFDPDSPIDWRYVGWGGVLVDDRPFGDPEPCPASCIPSLDDPAITDAAGGDWYDDDRIVFGVVVNGEARAYPKNIMEVHEMVNDELGGRRIGMPYCTLCGSAQAYYVDNVDGFSPVLRTSGLLIRSNKMMFDLETFSLIDTFTGQATSGPLLDAGVELEQISVVTSTWAEWKEAHPDTTIIAEDGGVGRTYRLDPLGDRDADGPIFPVGEVDPRLPEQEQVLGIILPDGTPIASPVAEARATLEAGEEIDFGAIFLEIDGGGVRAVNADGTDAGGHQAFWFAWSQFHPETLIWPTDFE